MEQLSLFGAGESLSFPEDLLVYFPGFLGKVEATGLMEKLINEVSWRQQRIQMYGKQMMTPRLTAWYGDASKSYQFSGTRFFPLPWLPELADLKNKIEEKTKLSFNSVLLNYYRDGNDSVAWHSDNERELGINPHIASLSIGAARKFEFRHKDEHSKKYGLTLDNGSLLIMKGDLQHHWEHRIPKVGQQIGSRVNLTFRYII